LEQVIMNLVVNACDAMPEGGQLTIQTATVDLDAHQASALGELPAGSYALLSMSDTGMGMDATTRSRVFEPFFTTKGPGKGTGLGLATVFGIVKQSNGHIEIESALGAGTTLYIYLPQQDGPGLLSDLAGFTAAVAPTGSETILLVEDEAQIRTLASAALQEAGYTILEAVGGAEAIQHFEQQPNAIDLLLTDVVMPGMNGRALGAYLTGHKPTLRVLYMSGYADDEIAPIVDVPLLPKPFTPDDLARKVRAVLDAHV
jgi:two-component system, cell cycle sensor histidine kinase and response regulator CckA